MHTYSFNHYIMGLLYQGEYSPTMQLIELQKFWKLEFSILLSKKTKYCVMKSNL